MAKDLLTNDIIDDVKEKLDRIPAIVEKVFDLLVNEGLNPKIEDFYIKIQTDEARIIIEESGVEIDDSKQRAYKSQEELDNEAEERILNEVI